VKRQQVLGFGPAIEVEDDTDLSPAMSVYWKRWHGVRRAEPAERLEEKRESDHCHVRPPNE